MSEDLGLGIPVITSELVPPGTAYVFSPPTLPGFRFRGRDTRTPIFDETVADLGRPELLREPNVLGSAIRDYVRLLGLTTYHPAAAVIVGGLT